MSNTECSIEEAHERKLERRTVDRAFHQRRSGVVELRPPGMMSHWRVELLRDRAHTLSHKHTNATLSCPRREVERTRGTAVPRRTLERVRERAFHPGEPEATSLATTMPPE